MPRHRRARCQSSSVSAVFVLLMIVLNAENFSFVRAWSSMVPPTGTSTSSNKYKVQPTTKATPQQPSLYSPQLQHDQRHRQLATSAEGQSRATTPTKAFMFSIRAQEVDSEREDSQRMAGLLSPSSSDRADIDDKNNNWINAQLLPVLSAACLITGNTVGAGCLVMPEIAAGPGMALSTGVFAGAYAVNWLSGLVIAEICCLQQEYQQTGNNDDETEADDTASFTAMAKASLSSPLAAQFIWAVSIFVNSCVMAFDVGRAGVVGSNLIHSSSSVWMLSTLPQQLQEMLGTAPDLGPGLVSALWATILTGLLCQYSSQQLSRVAAACVMAVFVSFGGLVLPGLAAVADPMATLLQPGTAAASVTGSADTLMASLGHAAPVILVSMIYQNIVPTVAKILNYERPQIMSAITIGSVIPLFMYLAWCLASLGGGIDTSSLTSAAALASSTGGSMPSWTMGLLALFSMATLAGSSLGTAMSLSGEYTSLLQALGLGGKDADDDKPADADDDVVVSPVAALFAVGIPLSAAWGFAAYSPDGITTALSLAGSFGSPILYGVLPAWMAWNVRQQQEQRQQEEERKVESMPWFLPRASQEQKATPGHLVPAPSLPLLGVLATGFVGQEVAQRVSEVL